MTNMEIRDKLRDVKYDLVSLMSNQKLRAAEQRYLEDAYALINTVVCSLNDKIKVDEK